MSTPWSRCSFLSAALRCFSLNSRLIAFALILALYAGAPDRTPAASQTRIRLIILSSQHLGAHGMGYNDRSLLALSRRLTPADIPAVISLAATSDLRVGVQFALASQCEASILPVREAALHHTMDFLGASDTMNLIAEFSACSPLARHKALDMRAELGKLSEAEYAQMEQESKRKA